MVLKVGVPELVDRADRAQQTQPVRIIQERHQRARELTCPSKPVCGDQVRQPCMVVSDRESDRESDRKHEREDDRRPPS
ncbi:hypothetical protein [Herbidospora cretacea]|uniref:hypothetical protein n=1 Tax=Herbidospora cretacea TaxID=28444 RepID=UPI0012DED61A|nr:hypothetical protein [Herbidospora cretacea]